MKFNWLFVVVASVGMCAIAGTARADLIHGNAVTDNGTTGCGSVLFASDGYVSDANKWYTNMTAPDYFDNGGTVPVLTIDLGANYTLAGASLWNYNVAGNATKAFSLAFSTDGAYGASTDYQTAVPLINNTENYDSIPREDFAFTTVTARYVRMTITDNWCGAVCGDGSSAIGGDRVGFLDVQFATVPEPHMLILLATGLLGLLAYAWRKQR